MSYAYLNHFLYYMVRIIVKKFSFKNLLNRTFVLVSFGILLVSTIITFLLINSKYSLDFRSRAATGDSNNILFVDDQGYPILETNSAFVRVKLVSPWSLATASKSAASESVAGVSDVMGVQNTQFQIKTGSDDVIQDGTNFSMSSELWIGNGQSTSSSWTGLRFTNVDIPKNATIKTANLGLFSKSYQWMNINTVIRADDTSNSPAFSSTTKPSQRQLTSNLLSYKNNVRWEENKWYYLPNMKDVVQEVINRPDWESGNSLSIIFRGNGKQWSRKYISDFETNPVTAPKLLITYTTPDSASPTTTVSYTITNQPTSTPTPVPSTVSVELAEDTTFSKNYTKIAYTSNPLTTVYTFSDAAAGKKTLYARFTASNGEQKVFSNWIDLVINATATPTSTPEANLSPTPTPAITTKQIWGVVDPSILGTCSAEVHDKYVVDGNDGYLYRTWHPQVDPSGCVFAHEHGDNPDNMKDAWVRANWDPRFGYAARRMKSAAEPNGHVEAHEGYKVFAANVGDVNDEGRVNRTASLSYFHMGTGTPKRFTIQHHSNSIAYRYQTGTPYASTHLLVDTGGVSDVCDPRTSAPTKDGLMLQNRCKVNSPYEIWSTFQTIKDGGREIYRVFVVPAVFDPITVFNKDNPLEVVYAWDPRVSAIKNFNDDWSGHRGCKRENYAQVGYFYNEGGPTTYFTDPMGNVVPENDPMAIRQIVSPVNIVGLASTQDNLQFKKPTDYCGQVDKLGLKN